MLCRVKFLPKFYGMNCICQNKNIHFCSIYLKKKEWFYNIYVQEYRPKVYTGFIEDHFIKMHKNSLFNIEDDAPDFEKSLIREARHRRRMYKKKRYLKEMGVNIKPTMPKFTADQMHQIKFLHSENPSLWTSSYLATSFGVEIPVIKKILRSKVEDISTNSSSSESSNFMNCSDHSKSIMPISYQDLLHSPEESMAEFQPHQKEDNEIKENQWFSNFPLNRKDEELIEISDYEDLEQLLEEIPEDEHDEIFDVEQEEEETDDSVDDEKFHEHESALEDLANETKDDSGFKSIDSINLTSTDNVNFYDEEGRFLYRTS